MDQNTIISIKDRKTWGPCFNYNLNNMTTILVLLTTIIATLNYYEVQHYVVYAVERPLWQHIAFIAIVVLFRLARWFYNMRPFFRGMFGSVNRLSNRLDNFSKNLNNSPFKNGQKRRISSSPVWRASTKTNKPTLPLLSEVGGVVPGDSGSSFSILRALKTKYQTVLRMIPLTDKIGSILRGPLLMNSILSFGRETGLFWRVKITSNFLIFVLKYKKDHGTEATVKWLKACHVSLQKALGKDGLKSTVSLGTALPFSRLAGGGYPRIIPHSDRVLMRQGHVNTIRFWLGLLNLYRVLKCKGMLKLETITSPFSGSPFGLKRILVFIRKEGTFFESLKIFRQIRDSNLHPNNFVLSRSASPSNSIASIGILTDIAWMKESHLWKHVVDYLSLTQKGKYNFLSFIEAGLSVTNVLRARPDVATSLSGKPIWRDNLNDRMKISMDTHGYYPMDGLSQFAFKEEAAGKIRTFALLDSLTQSLLRPLHDTLFLLLKNIPNDGTFDQEEAVRRCQAKALHAGMAISFDLTAATDRIPAQLTASILSSIFRLENLGKIWLSLMTDRDFWITAMAAKKHKVSQGPYRYAVGQPMGGLSSWAGLAITHHFLVQLSAYRVYGTKSWNESYEILGDDLVIFDKKIADEYLKLMEIVGTEINLTKSINSLTLPVFEFAKRTVWGPNIVSGISLAQVLAGWNVAGRVANVLSFTTHGLMTKPSLVAAAISRYTLSKGKTSSGWLRTSSFLTNQRMFALGAISLLGVFFQNGILPLRVLLASIVDPRNEDADYSGDSVGVPLKKTIELAHAILTQPRENPLSAESEIFKEPFSKMEFRDEVFDEYSPELATVVLTKALSKAKNLYENSENYIKGYSLLLVKPFFYGEVGEFGKPVPVSDLRPDDSLAYLAIENFANRLLGMEFLKQNPEWLYETIYDLAYKQAKSQDRLVSFSEALQWLEKVEDLEFKLIIKEKVKPGRTILETPPLFASLRDMDPSKLRNIDYVNVPNFDNPVQGRYLSFD